MGGEPPTRDPAGLAMLAAAWDQASSDEDRAAAQSARSRADWVRNKAARPTMIPPPLHIAEKLGAKVVDRVPEGAGEEVCDGVWIKYRWDPDQRVRGGRIYHGLGHRAFVRAKWPHNEADAWWMAAELAMPMAVVPRMRSIRHALKSSPWAPAWLLQAQIDAATFILRGMTGIYKPTSKKRRGRLDGLELRF